MHLNWHPPAVSFINDLATVINGTGVNGFVFNSSVLPAGVPYGTYNWCNMPHVRPQEYLQVDESYVLEYVEVIHRHHKRTPYAANTFPKESYPWNCDDEGLFFYGMFPEHAGQDVPLLIQPASIDSLEPAYTCTAASELTNAYGPGSNSTAWLAHLDASAPLHASLDSISGVDPSASAWHTTWDHYFDNLSA
ncbi:hypothetical protein LTR28_002294, partial [Elasticomyces elasticus]